MNFQLVTKTFTTCFELFFVSYLLLAQRGFHFYVGASVVRWLLGGKGGHRWVVFGPSPLVISIKCLVWMCSVMFCSMSVVHLYFAFFDTN